MRGLPAYPLRKRVCGAILTVRTLVRQLRSPVLILGRVRAAEAPPQRTPSFVCEVALRVSRAQERTLLARLEAARQVYNACLGEARRRVQLVRQSKAFQRARTLPRDDAARKTLFAQPRPHPAFSEHALHAHVQAMGH